MLKLFIENNKELIKNPKEYYKRRDTSYEDTTTVFGFINALSFIAILVGTIYSIDYIIGHNAEAILGIIALVCEFIALSATICYIVVSDKVQNKKYDQTDALMVPVSLYIGAICSGSIAVLFSIIFVIDFMSLIVYYIPRFFIHKLCNMLNNHISKRSDNPAIKAGVENMQQQYNNFLK